jgi:hypothetical protein
MFKDTVRISGECFNLFEDIIYRFEDLVGRYFDTSYGATITSANDGIHSTNSLHAKNKAIDLRTKDIPQKRLPQKKYLELVIIELGEEYSDFVFILHLYDGKNHLHIQHGRDNIISFDSAIGENKNVFIK